MKYYDKVLILGSSGFVGRNIYEYLSKKKYSIVAPKRAELDLLDTKKVFEYISNCNPDIVVLSVVNMFSIEENLKIYFNLERCKNYFKKMITIGSGAEYDLKNRQSLTSESSFGKDMPSDVYGLSKYIISKDIEKNSHNIINLRVFGLYGKYEDYMRRVISNNICRAICGKDLVIQKNRVFDFLYIDDFLCMLEILIRFDAKYKNYNICTSNPVELKEVLNIIKATSGNNEKIIVKEYGQSPEYSGSNLRFIQEFGEFNFTSIEDGIKQLYLWYLRLPNIKQICNEIKNRD
jgi:GDP-L-fucose synthase